MKKKTSILLLIFTVLAMAVSPLFSVAAFADDYTGLPDWYPEDTSNFSFFYDESAPRVIDNADILTDEEEAQLEDQISASIEKTGHDLVIVTDVTDYGLGQTGFADDFYDYNGYGFGEEHEGALFFVDMDPADRGGWCSCKGRDTMSLYDEVVANDIDNIVYYHLGRGEYYQGFGSWVSLMTNLFEKGEPFAPEWMPARGTEPNRTQDPYAPRVVDENELLTTDQRAELEGRLAQIREKYGTDVILFAPNYVSTMTNPEYRRCLYESRGYGLGTGNDAIIMTLKDGYCFPEAFGSAAITEVNQDRISEKSETAWMEGGAYEAALGAINDAEHMLRTGRVQKPLAAWITTALAGLFGGGLFGGVSASSAQSRMKTPRTATSAEQYLDRNSVRINNIYDTYITTHTNRVYDPPAERTSGGGGGGGGGHSSFSGGHTSSSGSTHSGSGRKF